MRLRKYGCAFMVIFLVVFVFFFSLKRNERKEPSEEMILQEEEYKSTDTQQIPVFSDILIGDDYYIALCEDGSVWSWGNNENCKLGLNLEGTDVPQKVDIPSSVIKIMDGGLNIWALTADGDVYIWGEFYRREGKRTAEKQGIVFPLKLKNIPQIEDISAENNHVAARGSDGGLYLWGIFHEPWQIPGGTTEIILEQLPEEYRKLTEEVQYMVVGAGRNYYFMKENGTVFSIMSRSAYSAYFERGFGFLFPNGSEEQNDITYYWADEISDAVILSPEKESYDCVIYFECEDITDVNRISSDDYTMFLYKNDGTLWYWMSDRVKYHDYENYLSSYPDDGLEHGKGKFESVNIAEIMNIQGDQAKPEIVDMCSNIENTLFLTSDGELFISSYVTDRIEDVEYYVKFNEDPGRLPAVEVRKEARISRITFESLDYHDIISINGDGQYNFSAIDSKGNYYHIK